MIARIPQHGWRALPFSPFRLGQEETKPASPPVPTDQPEPTPNEPPLPFIDGPFVAFAFDVAAVAASLLAAKVHGDFIRSAEREGRRPSPAIRRRYTFLWVLGSVMAAKGVMDLSRLQRT